MTIVTAPPTGEDPSKQPPACDSLATPDTPALSNKQPATSEQPVAANSMLSLVWALTQTAILGALAAAAVSSALRLDYFRLGMLLTYPPRLPLAVIAATLACSFLTLGGWRRSAVCMLCGIMFFADSGWQLAATQSAESESELAANSSANANIKYSILGFNVHNQADEAATVAKICRDLQIDFVCLQEVKRDSRNAFIKAMPNYAFYRADDTQTFAHSDYSPFTSMIGIRRRILTPIAEVEVATAITDYRTFGVKAVVNGTPMWIVNVHCTKPFWTGNGLSGVTENADMKSKWHQTEHHQLTQWMDAKEDIPIIVAGDFNAPLNSLNMQFDRAIIAHQAVGVGAALSFPRKFPVWGIDHTLGNRFIHFRGYETFDAGFSDHLAQFARFDLHPSEDR